MQIRKAVGYLSSLQNVARTSPSSPRSRHPQPVDSLINGPVRIRARFDRCSFEQKILTMFPGVNQCVPYVTVPGGYFTMPSSFFVYMYWERSKKQSFCKVDTNYLPPNRTKRSES